MKASEILKEEIKKELGHISEEIVMEITKFTLDKLIPRLALDAEEPSVRSACGVAQMIVPVIKPMLIVAIDKIDGEIGNAT
jgi:hypothetical protein